MKYTSQNKTTIVKQDVEYKWVILNYEAQDMKIIKDESKRKGKKILITLLTSLLCLCFRLQTIYWLTQY